MSSILHDTFNELLREHPALVVDVLRDRLGVDVPDGLPVQAAPVELNDRPSRDLHPDTVITVGPRQNPALAIIVEIQNGPMDDKRVMLPRYAAALWLRLDCPVIVLVICPDRKIAARAAEPIPIALFGCALRPKVLGPDQIPVITDPSDVKATPLMAVLSVAIHGRRRSVVEAFTNAVQDRADGDNAYYYEYAYRMSSPEIRNLLEEIMATSWPVYSPVAKKHYYKGLEDGKAEGEAKGVAKGVAKGEAKGEAKAVLTFLDARGIPVPETIRARIDGCTDLVLLEKLLRRAATVTNAQDLFTEQSD